jgi:hypothetical protein
MGLQEGLQIAQWLLNLNRQGQIDRENKAYQDRIIQQQDEQRRQEMATNDAISAMLAGSGEANDMFTQLPSLQNQAKILGTLQATGGMFGGPFSMMGDASRAAYNAASEGVSSFAQNPVLSLARLGLEKGGSPIDVAKYAQAISGMESPINRYQAEQAALAKDEAEMKKFVWQEGVKSTNRREETALSKGFDEKIAAMKLRGEGWGSGKDVLAVGSFATKEMADNLKDRLAKSNKELFEYVSTVKNGSNDGLEYDAEEVNARVEGIEEKFSTLMAHKFMTSPGGVDPEEFVSGYGRLLNDNGFGGISQREVSLRKELDEYVKRGDLKGALSILGAYSDDAEAVFLKGGQLLQYSPRTAGSGGAAFWASKGKEVKKAAWNKFYKPTVQKYDALIAKQKAIEIQEKIIADKRKAFSDALISSLLTPGRGMR